MMGVYVHLWFFVPFCCRPERGIGVQNIGNKALDVISAWRKQTENNMENKTVSKQ